MQEAFHLIHQEEDTQSNQCENVESEECLSNYLNTILTYTKEASRDNG